MSDLRAQLQGSLGSAYTIERELGGGGMSRVFLADEVAYGRKVVVKVVPPDVGAGVNVDRFRREIQVAARLLHPHIVPVLTSGEMDGVPYYTMPFVDGQSLRARLAQGPLSITEAVGVLRDVAKALAYAHEHGVVHRDIKPDNILLTGSSAVVADFGIAKAISAARDATGGSTLTQVGTSLGTPAYMAPEQAAADPATNHRADIYAFGCVAYEALTGRPPFVAKTPQRLLAAQMGEQPQHVSALRADTPPELADLVMRCLAKDADSRPQSAQDIVRLLETVTSGGGHAAMPAILASPAGTFGRAMMYYAAAFVAVMVLARAATVAVGVPDWVVPGSAVVMLLGLPVLLFTAYVQRVARRALTSTPTYTPGGTPSMQGGTMATLALKASPHVSWSRAARGGAIALGCFVFLIGAFMAMRALGIGPAGSLFAAGKLSRDEPLLVTDFAVRGSADSALGSVVSEALRTELSQSSVIKVFPASGIREALQRMQRPVTSRLDAELSREIALRERMRAVVDGDITPLGDGFVVTARVLAAESGDAIATFSEIADTPLDLISTVGKVGRQLRARVGESLKSVRDTPPLDRVSTQSLDALRKYVEGMRVFALGDYQAAVPFFREAVAIDSNFAMAWRTLAALYSNLRLAEDQDSAITRAYRLRDRLPEEERLSVEAYYFHYGPGRDRARAAAAYENLVARGSLFAPNNLGIVFLSRRQFARAESLYRAQIAAGGSQAPLFANLQWALVYQGKDVAADSVMQLVLRRTPPPPTQRLFRSAVLYFRGQLDSVAALAASEQSSADPRTRSVAIAWSAALQQVRGRLTQALRTRSEMRAIDSARGLRSHPFAAVLDSVRVDAWYRNQGARAAARMDSMLARRPLRSVAMPQRPYLEIADHYALAGRPDRARAILAQYEADVRDTTRRRGDAPQVQSTMAEIARAERRYDDAVRLAYASFTLPDGPVDECAACDDAMLARIFDEANMPDSAIAHYERYMERPDFLKLNYDQWFLPLALKRLGEMYEARGEWEKAYARYARFVELWKNADPDQQPKVQAIRQRMARLRAGER